MGKGRTWCLKPARSLHTLSRNRALWFMFNSPAMSVIVLFLSWFASRKILTNSSSNVSESATSLTVIMLRIQRTKPNYPRNIWWNAPVQTREEHMPNYLCFNYGKDDVWTTLCMNTYQSRCLCIVRVTLFKRMGRMTYIDAPRSKRKAFNKKNGCIKRPTA